MLQYSASSTRTLLPFCRSTNVWSYSHLTVKVLPFNIETLPVSFELGVIWSWGIISSSRRL